jgi:hypothetical protein
MRLAAAPRALELVERCVALQVTPP